MSVTFHVFANESYVTDVTNKTDTNAIRSYVDSMVG